MAIIIEDGNIITHSNSYATASQLETFAENIAYTLSGDEEALLHRALRYVEGLRFIGVKSTKNQAMQWPRTNAVIDGFNIDSSEIPRQLIDLQLSVALSIDRGVDPSATKERKTLKETVGPISVEYADDSDISTTDPTITALEYKLTRGMFVTVSRA